MSQIMQYMLQLTLTYVIQICAIDSISRLADYFLHIIDYTLAIGVRINNAYAIAELSMKLSIGNAPLRTLIFRYSVVINQELVELKRWKNIRDRFQN